MTTRVELSLNYSPAAARLVREGRIDVDRFKCTEWPEMIVPARELRPVYVHFPTNVGTGQTLDLDAIERIAADTDTPFVNAHLIARREDWPGVEDIESPDFDRRVTERFVRDVGALVSRFGADRVIAENLIYTGAGSKYLRAAIEPEAIRAVIAETGCGLLLDLSHARIAAHYKGVDWKDYLKRLPLDRLRELHVTGLAVVNGVLIDHEPLTEQDWRDVEWAMDRIRAGEWSRPWTVALEYGGTGGSFEHRSDPRVIEEQVPRLRELVTRLHRA